MEVSEARGSSTCVAGSQDQGIGKTVGAYDWARWSRRGVMEKVQSRSPEESRERPIKLGLAVQGRVQSASGIALPRVKSDRVDRNQLGPPRR
jgi:hypothetical protein